MEKIDTSSNLGDGKWGKVSKIKHQGKTYALKQFKRLESDCDTKGIYSVREIDISFRCSSHPFICYAEKIIQTISDDKTIDNYAMAMEYCEYDLENFLYKIVKNTIPNLEVKKSIMLQILIAVEYIHQKGIYHNDIKPENILIKKDTEGYIAKLCDFGLSTFNPVPYLCTSCYRPPEMCVDKVNFDQRSDIWALGCVFYEMITGKLYNKVCDEDNIAILQEIIRQNNINRKTPIKKALGKVNVSPSRRVRSAIQNLNIVYNLDQWDDFIELLKGMLEFDHKKRWTATEALDSKFFENEREEIKEMRETFSPQPLVIKNIKLSSMPQDVQKFLLELNDIKEWQEVLNHACILYSSYYPNESDKSRSTLHLFQTMYLVHKFYCVLETIIPWEEFVDEEYIDQWDEDFEIELLKFLSFEIYVPHKLDMRN
jgi:serine/threonine protein kinase